MSNRPDVLTQPLTRADLAQFLKSPRAIKAFENMLKDLMATLPDSIQEVGDHADDIEGFLNGVNATAQEAFALARAGLQEEVPAQIGYILARLGQLERAVANLKEGPTP